MSPLRSSSEDAGMSNNLLARLRALVGHGWAHGADPADGAVDERRVSSEETFEGRKDDVEIDEYFLLPRDVE